jgi:CBS domain-containing protein
MKCSDLMNMNLQWVPATASVAEAAQIMRDQSVGFLLVSGATPGELEGVVTDRDIAIRCCAESRRPDGALVADIATREVQTCDRNASLKVAEQQMIASEKSRLVIVDEIGRPVGVLSLTDILYRDWGRRAIRTARGILAREAEGPHPPLESIKLTPSTPEDEDRAAHQESALHGGSWDRAVKMFP